MIQQCDGELVRHTRPQCCASTVTLLEMACRYGRSCRWLTQLGQNLDINGMFFFYHESYNMILICLLFIRCANPLFIVFICKFAQPLLFFLYSHFSKKEFKKCAPNSVAPDPGHSFRHSSSIQNVLVCLQAVPGVRIVIMSDKIQTSLYELIFRL